MDQKFDERKEEEKIKIAKTMISKGIDGEKISEVTGLPKEKIASLLS